MDWNWPSKDDLRDEDDYEPGALNAEVEQVRAAAIDELRTAKMFSVTTVDMEVENGHHSSYCGLTEEIYPFLAFAAYKAVLDYAAILRGGTTEALKSLTFLINQMEAKRKEKE